MNSVPFNLVTLRYDGTRTHISSGKAHETLVINKKNQFTVLVPSCFKNVSNNKNVLTFMKSWWVVDWASQEFLRFVETEGSMQYKSLLPNQNQNKSKNQLNPWEVRILKAASGMWRRVIWYRRSNA